MKFLLTRSSCYNDGEPRYIEIRSLKQLRKLYDQQGKFIIRKTADGKWMIEIYDTWRE